MRRIAIVDDADDFNDASSNALLKTLEEPPPGSILILICTGAERQLPTIRSRCHLIPFQPLPTPVVESLLRADPEIDPAVIPRIARLGGGSVELARELADPAIGQFRNSLLAAITTPKPDVAQAMKDFKAVIEQAGKESGEQRRRALLVVRLVVNALESALVGSAPDDPAYRPIIGRLSELGPERLVAMLERCMSAEEHIERRVQLSLAYEGLVDALLGASL
jgi:DNA polymerase-3 subunit delta'